MKRTLFILFLIFLGQSFSFAQDGLIKNLINRFVVQPDEIRMTNCDSTYVGLPEHNWAFKINGISSFSNFRIRFNGTPNYDYAIIKLGSGVSFKSSFSIAYKSLELGYTFDQTNRYSRDIKLSSYGKRFGGEIQYQSYKDAEAVIETYNPDGSLSYPNDYFNRLTVNGYYVFNYKKFSYPAAITQTYKQLKNAGSILLGASVFYNKVKLFTDDSELAQTCNPSISLWQASIGGGYGYNFLFFNSNLLFHISAMPMMLFTLSEKISGDLPDDYVKGDNKFSISPSLVSRASVCYTLKDRLALGLNAVYNYTGSNTNSNINIYSNGWIIQSCIGWRFL